MSNLQDSIRAASEQIKQAVVYEEQGKPGHALECYKRGIARFRLVVQTQRGNKQLCATLNDRIAGYQEAADRLSAQLESCLVEPVGGGGGGGGGGSHVNHNGGENSPYAQQMVPQKQVQWNDIVGLAETKRLLRETVILPHELAHLYTGIRRAPRGILLYGPPGNGKTELVRALACEMTAQDQRRPCNFFAFTSADIISKYVGESARNMRELFETIKAAKPCILFIDEIDSICSRRSDTQDGGGAKQALNEFLIQMDGLCAESMDDVLLIGATNLPWLLDGAMLRRMAARVSVPMPDREMRGALFARLINQNEHLLEAPHFAELADMSDGYSCSDITNVCCDAAMLPVRRLQDAQRFHKVVVEVGGRRVEHLMPCGEHCARETQHECVEARYAFFTDKSILLAPPILFGDLLDSLARNKSTVNQEDLARLDEFTAKHGQKA